MLPFRLRANASEIAIYPDGISVLEMPMDNAQFITFFGASGEFRGSVLDVAGFRSEWE